MNADSAESSSTGGITMTTYITIRNNCKTATIHCAISWAGIQQDYRNDIGPNGGYGEYELNDWGDHDFTIIWGTDENRFKSENNNKVDMKAILRFASFLTINPLGILASLGSLAGDLQIKPSDIESGNVIVKTQRPPTIQNGREVESPNINLTAYPILIDGLHTLNGNDIVVTGGDLKGEYVKATKTYYIYGAEPLRAHWSNRLKNKSEQDYVARSS
jgi:hypothetical protein